MENLNKDFYDKLPSMACEVLSELIKAHKEEEWGGWKIVSDMLDRPNEYGIYPTGECYQKLYEFVVSQKQKALAKTREETLKELIREYQDNELDGKGYDFYFSIRAKIDELNKLKQ